MYCKNIFIGLVILISSIQCNSQNKKEMEEKIIDIKKNWIEQEFITYPTHPLYSLQVNKNKCRVVVRCNGLPHWLPLTENSGESMTLYLNDYIPKSGRQLLTIEIYPNEGSQYFPADVVADVRLQYAKDKMTTPINEFQSITQQSLPEDTGDKKLSYYEMKISFDATVPYDFSNDLASAQNLSKISDIDQKLLAKYNYLKKLMETGEGVKFVNEFKHNYKLSNYLYASKNELLSTINKEDDNDLILFCSDEGDYRKISEFKDYEVVYGFNGKVAMLRSKRNKKTMFNVLVGGEYDDPFWYTIYLYMPQGSNELKLW